MRLTKANYASGASIVKSCSEDRVRMSNELTGLLFLIGTLECEVHGQSVNPWIRACRNFHTGIIPEYAGVRNFAAKSCAG
jgi:hypothetical protein